MGRRGLWTLIAVLLFAGSALQLVAVVLGGVRWSSLIGVAPLVLGIYAISRARRYSHDQTSSRADDDR